MKAIGLLQGQIGDECVSTVAARVFKSLHPDCKLVMGINKKYADIIPLFYQHESFDTFHLYETYNGWPGKADLSYLRAANYDLIFNAMPSTTSNDWFRTLHQTQEVCAMHGIIPPPLEGCQCSLNPWWADYVERRKDYVAIQAIGASYQGYPNAKSYSPAQVKIITDYVHSRGYKTLQIGGPNEPVFDGMDANMAGKLSYFESVKTIYSCKSLITIDTGACWVMSSFSFPTLAAYANAYYGVDRVCAIQPINPNGVYIDAPTMADITEEQLCSGIDKLLS